MGCQRLHREVWALRSELGAIRQATAMNLDEQHEQGVKAVELAQAEAQARHEPLHLELASALAELRSLSANDNPTPGAKRVSHHGGGRE